MYLSCGFYPTYTRSQSPSGPATTPQNGSSCGTVGFLAGKRRNGKKSYGRGRLPSMGGEFGQNMDTPSSKAPSPSSPPSDRPPLPAASLGFTRPPLGKGVQQALAAEGGHKHPARLFFFFFASADAVRA